MSEPKSIWIRYRRVGVAAEKTCRTCIRKVEVPWWWCDEVGQQTRADMVCDRHEGRTA